MIHYQLKYTQSPYSLFYFFRRYNIQDFKDKKLSLIQNKKISQINLKIRKNQIINVPAGDYVCTIASPVGEIIKVLKIRLRWILCIQIILKNIQLKLG